MWEKDDYDSENSWISDGLPSSSRRRRRGGGRWEVGEWREKRSASAIDVDVDGTKSQTKVGRSCAESHCIFSVELFAVPGKAWRRYVHPPLHLFTPPLPLLGRY